IDFWAVWCGPCKMIAPIVEELASEYNGRIKIGKLDVDSNQQTSIKFGVRSIPTLLLFKDGKLKDTIIGAVPKKHLVDKINTVL
ncbi:MAG: thioredoxin, partial [Ignavibacteriales bacterium]